LASRINGTDAAIGERKIGVKTGNGKEDELSSLGESSLVSNCGVLYRRRTPSITRFTGRQK